MQSFTNIGEIEDILMRLAKQAGNTFGIEIGYESIPGTQKGGEWEFHVLNYSVIRSQEHNHYIRSRFVLTHWVSPNGCYDEKSELTLLFPLSSDEERKVFVEFAKLIKGIKEQVSQTKDQF